MEQFAPLIQLFAAINFAYAISDKFREKLYIKILNIDEKLKKYTELNGRCNGRIDYLISYETSSDDKDQLINQFKIKSSIIDSHTVSINDEKNGTRELNWFNNLCFFSGCFCTMLLLISAIEGHSVVYKFNDCSYIFISLIIYIYLLISNVKITWSLLPNWVKSALNFFITNNKIPIIILYNFLFALCLFFGFSSIEHLHDSIHGWPILLAILIFMTSHFAIIYFGVTLYPKSYLKQKTLKDLESEINDLITNMEMYLKGAKDGKSAINNSNIK